MHQTIFVSRCECRPTAMERIDDDVHREIRHAFRLLHARLIDDEHATRARWRLERLRIREAAMYILLVEAREEFHYRIRALLEALAEPIDRLEGAIRLHEVFGPVPSISGDRS